MSHVDPLRRTHKARVTSQRAAGVRKVLRHDRRKARQLAAAARLRGVKGPARLAVYYR